MLSWKGWWGRRTRKRYEVVGERTIRPLQQLALKKQSMLLKELQKALKEEKRRAESVEKAKEREWHVVDPDTRSNVGRPGIPGQKRDYRHTTATRASPL